MLIATVHTTDPRLLFVAVNAFAVELDDGLDLVYVAGGVEVHGGTALESKPAPAAPTTHPTPPTSAKPKPAVGNPGGAGTPRTAQRQPPDPCPHCGRVFTRAAGRQVHIDACGAEGAPQHVCSCGQAFRLPNGLARHRNHTGHPAAAAPDMTITEPIARVPFDPDAARAAAAGAI